MEEFLQAVPLTGLSYMAGALVSSGATYRTHGFSTKRHNPTLTSKAVGWALVVLGLTIYGRISTEEMRRQNAK